MNDSSFHQRNTTINDIHLNFKIAHLGSSLLTRGPLIKIRQIKEFIITITNKIMHARVFHYQLITKDDFLAVNEKSRTKDWYTSKKNSWSILPFICFVYSVAKRNDFLQGIWKKVWLCPNISQGGSTLVILCNICICYCKNRREGRFSLCLSFRVRKKPPPNFAKMQTQ